MLPNTEVNMLANMTTFREALRVIGSLRDSSSWSFDLLEASKLLGSIATISRSVWFADTCYSDADRELCIFLVDCKKSRN